MGWEGGRGYFLHELRRESHVGEISQFLTFRSRIALVAIEGLVIFGIWCVLVCHCPHGCAAGLKLNKVAVRKGESNGELKVREGWQRGACYS